MPSEVENTVVELHHYLSGQTPPLRAAELFEALVAMPPGRIAAEIQTWVQAQRQASPTTPRSDFVFHALRKLYLFGELGVVDAGRADTFFDWLLPLAVESTPHDERAGLRARIAAMTHRVSVVPTFSGKTPIPATPPSPIDSETVPTPSGDQFALILDRLSRDAAAGKVMETLEALNTVAQLVMLAASTASTRDEFRDLIRRVPPLVDPSQLGNVFQLLARTIPPWEIVLPDGEGAACIPSAIPAMHKIVALSGDELERAKRLRELIHAAVQQFNTGSLFAASNMLDAGRTVIAATEVPKAAVVRIAGEAAAALDEARLRAYALEPSRHALLRSVLVFFPTLSPEGLLSELRGERRPERRRSLLGLLEVWGSAAREAALRQLRTELEMGPAADTWFLRNTIFLLNRIPRESEAGMEEELEALRQASSRSQVVWVIKEAIMAICAIRGAQATRLLLERLGDLENVLLRGDESRGPLAESYKAVDRVIAGLAKSATPEALRRVVRHGLRSEPMLGDTRARISCLAQADLSAAPDAVDALIAAIRAELPGVLGRVIGKPANAAPLIQTLASTDTAPVRALLGEISSRYQRVDLGAVADTTRQQLDTPGTRSDVPPVKPLPAGGELRPFGLPELLQSLAQGKASGVLAVADAERRGRGRLVFRAGRILDAECSTLRDDEAVFDLVEHPDAGWYTFAAQQATNGNLGADITPLLVEGLRRHDGLGRARVLVPDNATYKHAGPRPTPYSEERDPALMKEVWRRTVSGRTVRSWESELPADAFRVRSLIVHWLIEGAIEQAEAAY